MSVGDAAAFLLVAVLAAAVLWGRQIPFWARVLLVLLALVCMVLTLLSGVGRL